MHERKQVTTTKAKMLLVIPPMRVRSHFTRNRDFPTETRSSPAQVASFEAQLDLVEFTNNMHAQPPQMGGLSSELCKYGYIYAYINVDMSMQAEAQQ